MVVHLRGVRLPLSEETLYINRQLVEAHNTGVDLLNNAACAMPWNAGDDLRLLEACEQDEDGALSPVSAPGAASGPGGPASGLASELIPWRKARAWLRETLRGTPAGSDGDRPAGTSAGGPTELRLGDAPFAEMVVAAWLTAELRAPRKLSLAGWPRVVLTPLGRVRLLPENQARPPPAFPHT